jgi:hypothetical protein
MAPIPTSTSPVQRHDAVSERRTDAEAVGPIGNGMIARFIEGRRS